jgi:hypothetical protein
MSKENKTMKTKLFAAIALALVLATSGFAQSTPVSGHVGSDTAGSVAMLIKYVGAAAASATTDVAVAAGGDMTFRVAGVASTTVNSAAVCGATAGTLDLSTPAATCDTLGEVVDVINATSDWRAVLVGALRTDSSDNTLTTFAVAAAMRADGIAVYFDSAVSLTTSIPLIPDNCKTDIRCFMSPQGKLQENPDGGTQTELRLLSGYATWATTGTFNVYSVKASNKAGTSSQTISTLWSEALAVSATNQSVTEDFLGKPHERVIVRITTTGASSAFVLHAYGVRTSVQ